MTAAAPAPGGGIADEPCPTTAGEHTNACPAGTVGVPYRIRFHEQDDSGCGPGRQTFRHDSGSLPPGLALSADGTLSGRPLAGGRFRFYVEMREPEDDPATCAGKRTQKQFTLWIRPPLSIETVPASPPPAEVGVPLRIRLQARGGSGLFFWRRVAGRFPPGVHIDENGSIAGIPRRAGTYHLELTVRDTEARYASWKGTLGVAPSLVVRSRPLPVATAGRRYSARLTAHGGVPPMTWRLTRGRLPRGLRLETRDGRFVGRPRDVGMYRVTVEVRDALRVTVAQALTIVVASRSTTSR